MGAIRAAAAAVLVVFTAVAAVGDCVTTSKLISTRSSKPNLVSGPVAWSGSVLGVAKTQENAATAVWFGVYDEALQTLVPDRLVANDSRDIVSLEWTGTEFGLFYRTAQTQRLHLQRISMMGEPIGGPIPITPGRTVYASDEIEIEWNGAADAYVIARNISQGQFKGLWVTYVSRDGTHRLDRRLPVIVAPQSNLSLSVTEAGVAGIAYTNSNDGISILIMTETSIPIANTVTTTQGYYIETAAFGNRFVITHAVSEGGKTTIHWLVVDTSHQVIEPDSLLLEGSGDDVWSLALVATDEELALAYVDTKDRNEPLDTEYRLRRFTIDGTTLTDTYFAAADFGAATRSDSVFDFAWTGSAYLQATYRQTPDRLNSHLLKYCPLRAHVITDVVAGRPGAPVVFTAVPDGGVPGYSYAWTFGDPTRVFRTQSVSRTYDAVGTYTATLTVTDTAGATYTTTYSVNVVTVRRRASRH
jgi:hypothetical protein